MELKSTWLVGYPETYQDLQEDEEWIGNALTGQWVAGKTEDYATLFRHDWVTGLLTPIATTEHEDFKVLGELICALFCEND